MIFVYVFYCPVCNNKYTSERSFSEVEERVRTHVERQHPVYDPHWYETSPENLELIEETHNKPTGPL